MALDFSTAFNKNKPTFMITLFLVVIIVSALIYWIVTPRTVPLVTGIDPQKALAITQVLDKEKIAYTLQDGGETIAVNQAVLDTAKLKVYAANANLAHEVGLEIFSGNDLGMTDFTQHVNLVRALQGELARTITGLPGIAKARVHISIPEMSGNSRNKELRAKAAITVQMADTVTLSPEQAIAIQQLVSAAVPNLKMNDVSIIDGQGVPIATTDESMQSGGAHRTQEEYLDSKIRKMLKPILGEHGKVSVSVAIAYSQQQKNISKEQLLPSGSHLGLPVGILQSSKTRADDTSTSGAQETGQSPTSELTFSAGRYVERIDEGPNKISRISASIVISSADYYLSAAAYEKLVTDAIGLDTRRGDHVTVEILPPNDTATTAPLIDVPVAASSTKQKAPSLKPDQKTGNTYGWGTGLVALIVVLASFGAYRLSKRPKQYDQLFAELKVLLARIK